MWHMRRFKPCAKTRRHRMFFRRFCYRKIIINRKLWSGRSCFGTDWTVIVLMLNMHQRLHARQIFGLVKSIWFFEIPRENSNFYCIRAALKYCAIPCSKTRRLLGHWWFWIIIFQGLVVKLVSVVLLGFWRRLRCFSRVKTTSVLSLFPTQHFILVYSWYSGELGFQIWQRSPRPSRFRFSKVLKYQSRFEPISINSIFNATLL